MSTEKRIEYYDEFDYQDNEEYQDGYDSNISKKKKKLDPYDRHKERRNSKINPRFISLDEDEY